MKSFTHEGHDEQSDRGLLDGQSADEPAVEVSEDDPFVALRASGATGFPQRLYGTSADLCLSFGAVGEIICQSPLATQGYYQNPDATTASFHDCCFYTDDNGYFDDEGFLFVSGRKQRYG